MPGWQKPGLGKTGQVSVFQGTVASPQHLQAQTAHGKELLRCSSAGCDVERNSSLLPGGAEKTSETSNMERRVLTGGAAPGVTEDWPHA